MAGGGASGFFAAVEAARVIGGGGRVLLLEAAKPLTKVAPSAFPCVFPCAVAVLIIPATFFSFPLSSDPQMPPIVPKNVIP